MSALKVLHVTAVEQDNYFLNNLVDDSRDSGIEYTAVTLGSQGGFTEGLEQRGVRTYALDALSRRRYPSAAARLYRILRDEHPDIVHTHLFDPTLMSIALSRVVGLKTIVTRHHSDAIHTIPSAWKRRAYLTLEGFVNRSADRIIAPSQMVYDILTQRESVPATKISLIPYGLKMERFSAVTDADAQRVRVEFGGKEAFLVVTVCRLHPEKGHRFLFDAFSEFVLRVPNARLVLVGIGPIEAELRDRVRKLDLESRVQFAGWRKDALALIRAADLVVHPSLQEALPSAVIETLAFARPIVATDVSGIRDLIGNDEHGWIVPSRESGALLRAMLDAHERYQEANRRAERGREFVFSHLNSPRIARMHVECYEQVMRENRS